MNSNITRKKAREEIREAIEAHGPYTHNILSLILRQIANRFGTADAIKLIREFNLTERFGIQQRQAPHRK